MEILVYNKKSLADLVRVLRIILRQIMLLDDYMTTTENYMSRVVSNKNLVRYEKGSKYYTFHFKDHYEISPIFPSQEKVVIRLRIICIFGKIHGSNK